MIEQHNNSVIFRDVYENKILDFSHIASDSKANIIDLYEENHFFEVGDAIYYDIYTHHYRRALAINSIMSEVIGVVSKIINLNEFQLTLRGDIILNRYDSISIGSPLYLSDIVTGKLISNEPSKISKIIGIKTDNGIRVDIQRGFHLTDNEGYHPKYKEFLTKDLLNIFGKDNKIFNAAPDPNQPDIVIDDRLSLRYYTQEEIQEIIARVIADIY